MEAGSSSAINARSGDRLNILFVTPRFPPFMGGVETHSFEVGRRMAAKGHAIHVLTGDPSGELPREEIAARMRISRVAVYPRSSDIFFAPGMFGKILRTKVDIIHIQGFHSFVPPIAALAAIWSSAAFVITFHSGGHSSQFRNAIRGAQCATFRPLIARAEKLIAVSDFEANLFSGRLWIPRDRFVIVPNGAEIEAPVDVAAADQGAPLIVSIGRLERYKGHHRVIAAFRELLKRRPSARLRVCGEGPYKNQLQRLVERLGLQASVTIGGFPPAERKQMATLLAQASVVALLSDYEAHPVAALEAISLGRPILASNTTGFAEMAAKGLLYGVDLDAPPEAHAALMLKVIDSPAAFAPPKGLVTDWNECTNSLINIYRDVLAAKSKKTSFPSPASPA
jgi:glycosyltransferase involved in cell wall biosynthesis